jgi:microcystin-dependent protein
MAIGEIRLFAGTWAPAGWAFCEGQTLNTADHPQLARRIGTTWGGDGEKTFVLPDLRGRAPMHQGEGTALGGSRTIPIAPVEQRRMPVGATIRINFLIQMRDLEWVDDEPLIGEIRMFAGNRRHRGWLPCDGSILRVSDNQILFSVVGRTFTEERSHHQIFALPDLRGRMAVHPAKSEKLGQTANARGIDELSEKKTHLTLHFFIAADGVFPGRA